MIIKKRNMHLKIAGINTNSLMVAIILCFSLINGAIGIDNVSYITIAFVWLLFLYGVIKRKIHFGKLSLLILAYILIAFLFSFFVVSDTTYTTSYFMYFTGFVAISFLIGMQEFDIEKAEHYTEILGFICIIVFFVRGFDSYDPSLRMGISYSMLPVLLISTITILRKQFHIYSFINVALSIFFYVSIAPRGTWLTIGFFLILYVFFILSKGKRQEANRIKQFIVLLIIFTVVFYVFNNLSQIMTLINTLYYSVTGNRIYAIDKYSFLLGQGNIGNGREDLRTTALELIRRYPFTGRGIGYFETMEAGLYVHNIVLQTMVEAGIFFFIPFVIVMIKTILTLLNNRRMQNAIEYTFFIVITVNGLIILFYSSVYWQMLIFWFLIGYLLKWNNNQEAETI